jgi:tRNA modification GTPase
MDALRDRIVRGLDVMPRSDSPGLSNVRHAALVKQAHEAIERARIAAAAPVGRSEPLSEEFVLADLQAARNALEEVTGRRSSDDLLHHIFSRFCIGK